MREPHYGLVCFKSVKTLGGSPFLAVKKASAFALGPFSQLRMESSSGFILYLQANAIRCSYTGLKTTRIVNQRMCDVLCLLCSNNYVFQVSKHLRSTTCTLVFNNP